MQLSKFIQYFFILFLLLLYAVAMVFGLSYPPNPNRIIETWFFAILMHRYFPRVWRYSLWVSAFILLIYHPTAALYGRPSFGIVASLISTTGSEAGEYLQSIPLLTYIASVALALFVLVVARVGSKVSAPAFRWYYAVVLLLNIAIMAVSTGKKSYIRAGFPVRIQPIEFLADAYLMPKAYFKELALLKANLNKPDNWQISKVTQPYHNYVLIIGESERTDYMHVYGFKYGNTPFLDQHTNIIFKNMYSAGPNTPISLLHGLTLHNPQEIQLQNNIIALANKADMQTIWLSNQGALGQYDTSISSIAHKANEAYFLKKTGYDFGDKTYDDQLIPLLNKVLQSRNQPKQNRLIVMHIMGSHPNPCDRLRNPPYHYTENRNSNCYIDSVKATDQFLAGVYHSLTMANQPFSLFYFSDHGLSHAYNIYEKNSLTKSSSVLLHGDQMKQNYHTPLIIINSQDSQQKWLTAQRSGLYLIDGIAQWLGITSPQLTQQSQFFGNEDSKDIQVYDMNQHLKPVKDLGNDGLPEELR